MSPTCRPYRGEQDFWSSRAFLREVLRLNHGIEHSWDVVRWDYWRWHINENIYHLPLEDTVWIWETETGETAAILNPDNPGEAFLQVHPRHRSAVLEDEMIATAEEHLSFPKNGQSNLRLWAVEGDTLREDLFRQRGYLPSDWFEYARRRSMDIPVADVPLPTGYIVRSLGDRDELPARSWLSFKGFHPNEPEQNYEGWEWYLNVQRCPLYRRDLDLVAVAPDGTLASFCTVWFDDVNRIGVFEPVATHPDFKRRGLARAVMTEGLRRLKHLGALTATISSYSGEAHAAYEAVGFTEYTRIIPWVKEI
jgi:GNAT superfamily N-acetyltransferase